MYNPDNLIISKEEKMELPQSPVFYEDDYPYPWKPFKSNGGTGDAPADWLQPSTTVEPTLQPAVSKLCPFRKRTWFYTNDNYNSVPEYANHMEEEFLPCVKSECMFYSAYVQECICARRSLLHEIIKC